MKKQTATLAAKVKALALAAMMAFTLVPATPAYAAPVSSQPQVAAASKAASATVSSMAATKQKTSFRWLVARMQIVNANGLFGKADIAWKTDSQATGYQVRIAARKDMRGASTHRFGRGCRRARISGLKHFRSYYVQVRKVHTENGRTYYSSWTGAARVWVW